MKRISILGLGTMGKRMAACLVNSGFEVTAYNRSPLSNNQVDKIGCHLETSPHAATEGAILAMSCVSNDAASQQVWLGKDGAAKSLKPGTRVIELSTLSSSYFTEWANAMKELGLVPLDCPVTGSKIGATTGRLTAFVGAEEVDPTTESALRSFCSNLVFFKNLGEAMQFKLLYNFVGAAIACAIGEATSIAEQLGIDSESARIVLGTESWAAAAFQSKGDLMRARDYYPAAFTGQLMSKDLGYFKSLLDSKQLESTMLPLVHSLFEDLSQSNWSQADFSAIRELL